MMGARVDPSDRALAVARRNVAASTNCVFHAASVDEFRGADPAAVSEAARAELAVHRDADTRVRRAAAERARGLHHAEQLFGTAVFRDRAGDGTGIAAQDGAHAHDGDGADIAGRAGGE